MARRAQGLDSTAADRGRFARRSRPTAASGCGWPPFPHPFRSAFNLRVDLDEPVAEDYHRFGLARNLLADCCTHFVSTNAYRDEPEVLSDLRRYDTQSHGHYHYVYRDGEANRKNLEQADRILERRTASTSKASPRRTGAGTPRSTTRLESMGYRYSSDFRIGYDDLPFFPWKDGRFSRVLQVPVHPICEGLFLDAGASPTRRFIGDYLASVVEEKIAAGEPAFVYGHPERRLGRMPEVLFALARTLKARPLVWRTTLTEMARWWRWRADRKWLVIPRGGPLRGPVRRVVDRVSARPGDPSRRLPVLDPAHGPADQLESSASRL